MSTPIDLQQLALNRSPSPARRRPIVSCYVVPGALLAGFVALLAWSVREQFLPRTPVTVVPVVVSRATQQASGAPLFQAAGWIEPRPTPVLVTALTDGVIEKLLVVEGQSVDAGDPVARLIDTDARLALRQAEAELELRTAETASAMAEVQAAQLRYDNPLQLDAALAEAESQWAGVETERSKLPFQIESAAASLAFAEKNLASKRAAGDGISGRAISEAENAVAVASSQLRELQNRGPKLEREAEALKARHAALAEQRRRLVDEQQQLADAKAKLDAATARQKLAKLGVEQAELLLARTTVVAPTAGKVLALVARPGTRVAASSNGGEGTSTVIATLYDPAMLQVRADVRLEDVPLLTPGQPVQISTASSPEVLHGTLLFATSSANIQKNTLEVKVAIDDPPATIRPEMLVTATFLAPRVANDARDEAQPATVLLVPRSLVQSAGEGHAVWIVDGNETARLRSVRLGQAGTKELVEVADGLTPTDKLIASPPAQLVDGERVIVSGN